MPKIYSRSTGTSFTRRDFLKSSSLLAGATILGAPSFLRGQNLNEKINIACIGVNGKGDSDSNSAYDLGGNIVAICDVDDNSLNRKLKMLQDKAAKAGKSDFSPKLYRDFRKMLEEMDKSIDAVTVSTPDHCHGMASIAAMKLGKHIYCQKPLTQTVFEAREMRRLAKEKKLATQMGNQGSAGDGLRRAVEVIQGGVIGNPKELHVWSNRPIWPQGLDRPAGEDPVPSTLDWNQWLGPAAFRPYKKDVYHTFKWRGWLDFGTGALGDMACHTVNMPFRALKLGYPNVVECEMASRVYSETYPKTSRIRYEFPEREGLPPLKFWWYDGNPGDALRPLRPEADLVKEIIASRDKLPGSGCLIVGEKGKIFSPDDYGSQFYIMLKGEEDFKAGKDHEATKDIPKTIPRSPGHDQEWFRMMKTGEPAYSNFDIAAYLTEIILLGCIALRVGEGRRMEWDGPNMKSPNIPEAAQFVRRNYRDGWSV
jgi:predicted dehydrogenase